MPAQTTQPAASERIARTVNGWGMLMLRRQQAEAIIAARKIIVQNAVSMVHMALDELDQKNVVKLDDERKAAMVSNLLVVLCGNSDASPVINTGTLYT